MGTTRVATTSCGQEINAPRGETLFFFGVEFSYFPTLNGYKNKIKFWSIYEIDSDGVITKKKRYSKTILYMDLCAPSLNFWFSIFFFCVDNLILLLLLEYQNGKH